MHMHSSFQTVHLLIHIFFYFLPIHSVVFSINVMSNVVLIMYHDMILLELIRLQPLKLMTH